MTQRILVVGAGRVGTTFARTLSKKEFSVSYIFSKTLPENLSKYLPKTKPISTINKNIIHEIDVIIITVPDDQVKVVVKQLSSIKINWENKLVLHTSGCLNSNELIKLKEMGASIGSVHPMQTFNEYFLPEQIFRDIMFAVEGDKQAQHFAETIARQLKMNILKIRPEDKILYHIAAVASSNFLVALLDYVHRLYKELSLDGEKIKKLMLPILNQTIRNYLEYDTNSILTGPLQRGDVNTIKKHVNYLQKNQNELLPVYQEISNYISQFILKHDAFEKE